MGTRLHDLEAEVRMHSFSFDCDTCSNEEKVAVVVQGTYDEVTGVEGMLALGSYPLLVRCLMKRLGRSALGQMDGNILRRCLFESV